MNVWLWPVEDEVMTCVGHSGQFLKRGELSGGARDGVCVVEYTATAGSSG